MKKKLNIKSILSNAVTPLDNRTFYYSSNKLNRLEKNFLILQKNEYSTVSKENLNINP